MKPYRNRPPGTVLTAMRLIEAASGDKLRRPMRSIGPVYFPVKSGAFIQGLLASIGDHQHVCVVTVPSAAEYAGRWAEWPRVMSPKWYSTRRTRPD